MRINYYMRNIPQIGRDEKSWSTAVVRAHSHVIDILCDHLAIKHATWIQLPSLLVPIKSPLGPLKLPMKFAKWRLNDIH